MSKPKRPASIQKAPNASRRAAIFSRHISIGPGWPTDQGAEKRLVAEFGWECVTEYHDHRIGWITAIGGAMVMAIADAARKEFDVLVILRPARISLDLDVQQEVIWRLANEGVAVVTVDDNRKLPRDRTAEGGHGEVKELKALRPADWASRGDVRAGNELPDEPRGAFYKVRSSELSPSE